MGMTVVRIAAHALSLMIMSRVMNAAGSAAGTIAAIHSASRFALKGSMQDDTRHRRAEGRAPVGGVGGR